MARVLGWVSNRGIEGLEIPYLVLVAALSAGVIEACGCRVTNDERKVKPGELEYVGKRGSGENTSSFRRLWPRNDVCSYLKTVFMPTILLKYPCWI